MLPDVQLHWLFREALRPCWSCLVIALQVSFDLSSRKDDVSLHIFNREDLMRRKNDARSSFGEYSVLQAPSTTE